MGLSETLQHWAKRNAAAKPSSKTALPSINKFYDPLDDDPLDDDYWARGRRHDAAFYKSYYLNQTFQNPAGSSPGLAGSISGAGWGPEWTATRQPCPSCGTGMLANQQTHAYWCTSCCQKHTREQVHKRRIETALDWLDKQIARYTGR